MLKAGAGRGVGPYSKGRVSHPNEDGFYILGWLFIQIGQHVEGNWLISYVKVYPSFNVVVFGLSQQSPAEAEVQYFVQILEERKSGVGAGHGTCKAGVVCLRR